MGAAHFLCTFDYAVAVARLVIGLSELFVCEVVCDVEKWECFLDCFELIVLSEMLEDTISNGHLHSGSLLLVNIVIFSTTSHS
jgi:hypothetical protein